MIPLVIIAYFHKLLPEDDVHKAMAPVAAALPFSTDPYMCMFLAFFLAYVPMGIRLLFQMNFTSFVIKGIFI